MGPTSASLDVTWGFCVHMGVLVMSEYMGDGFSLFLSYLVLGLIFA